MKNIFIILFACLLLMSCSTNHPVVDKKLYRDQFPGFVFSSQTDAGNPVLSGYEYQGMEGGNVVVTSCEQASRIDVATIAEYDYSRFNLLLVSCEAIARYSTASAARASNFPPKLDEGFIYQLPAAVAPILSKAEFIQRQGLSIKSYDVDVRVTVDKENVFKILTNEDEVYLTLLARGDFTSDGLEDLLVQSEWYARNAHGKYVDLLVLSKTANDKNVEISWRLNRID